MNTSKSFARLFALMGLFALPFPTLAQTPQQREEMKVFLQEWKKTNLIEGSAFPALKAKYGDKTLPLLAEFLADKELGFHAQSAMDQIDSVGATPYKLKNLAHSDPNQQNATFRIANNALKEYEWHLRAGQPAEDPTKPKPRYPLNTKPYPFRKELHDAAVVELTTVLADKPIGAEREAIETIGLTGTKKDIPLLKRYAAKYGENPFLVAAMAKLGDRAAFSQIEDALKQPAKTKPEADWSDDSGKVHPARVGVMVTELESGKRLRTAMEQAAYTMNRRFIPLLLAHLDDPNGQHHGDYSDPSPSHYAMESLSRIVFGKYSVAWTAEQWKDWATKHPKEALGR